MKRITSLFQMDRQTFYQKYTLTSDIWNFFIRFTIFPSVGEVLDSFYEGERCNITLKELRQGSL